MAGDGLFQTAQKVATALYRLDEVTESVREVRSTLTTRVEQLEALVTNTHERVACMEAARESNHAGLHGDLAQVRAEGEAALGALRERVARLEAARDADHARFEADLSRFKLEVERAQLQLTRRLPGGPKEPRGE